MVNRKRWTHLEFALKVERGGLADGGVEEREESEVMAWLLVCVSGSLMVIYWDREDVV